MRNHHLIILAAMVLATGLFGCPAGGADTTTCGADVKVVNKASADVTDLNLLFMNKTMNKLYAGKEFSLSFRWKGEDPYTSSAHIEYLIDGAKYDSSKEQGDFKDKTLVIDNSLLLITIYDDYYTMEVLNQIEYEEAQS